MESFWEKQDTQRGMQKIRGPLRDKMNFSQQILRSACLFTKNKKDMENESLKWENWDKYFHCKANFDSAKQGLYGDQAALWASLAKEAYDIPVKTFFRKKDPDKTFKEVFKENLSDSKQDLEADFYGWVGGIFQGVNKKGKTSKEHCYKKYPKKESSSK